MVDTTKYKSIAIKIPYYDALVRMGMAAMRGPGQQMMHLIRREAEDKGIKIKLIKTNLIFEEKRKK